MRPALAAYRMALNDVGVAQAHPGNSRGSRPVQGRMQQIDKASKSPLESASPVSACRSFVSWAMVFLAAGFGGTASVAAASVEPATAAEEERRICLAPFQADVSSLSPQLGKLRGYDSYEFSVRIDEGEWIEVPADEPTYYPRFKAADKHLFAIRDGDRVVESFWFRFEPDAEELCLSFMELYQTWYLRPPANRPTCQCEDAPRANHQAVERTMQHPS